MLREGGSFLTNWERMSTRETRERPQSPLRKRVIQRTYWTGRGLFSPICSRT